MMDRAVHSVKTEGRLSGVLWFARRAFAVRVAPDGARGLCRGLSSGLDC